MSPDIPDRIEAGPVALRRPRPADVDALVDACRDPEIARWTRVPWPYDADDARALLRLAEEGYEDGDAAHYVLVDEDDELLGAAALHDIDHHDLTGEVGYWLARPARGRGVGTQAVRALVDWGFSIGLRRIEARVMVGNEPSRRLLERVGFVEEGLLRSLPAGGCGLDRDRIDVHVYGRILTDRP